MKLEEVYNEVIIERGEDYLDNIKSCINIEDNLDCLNFEQLLKILDYTYKNEDYINDSLSNNFNRYDDYEDEEIYLEIFSLQLRKRLLKGVK